MTDTPVRTALRLLQKILKKQRYPFLALSWQRFYWAISQNQKTDPDNLA